MGNSCSSAKRLDVETAKSLLSVSLLKVNSISLRAGSLVKVLVEPASPVNVLDAFG